MLTTQDSYTAIRTTAAVYERHAELLRLTGVQRMELVSWLLAKPAEFAHPGTAMESLLLDETGKAEGMAIVVIDDDEILIVAESPSSLREIANDAVVQRDLPHVEVMRSARAAIAIEGPLSWKVIENITPDPVSDILLREWRDGVIAGGPCRVVRLGTTAEYGYIVIVPAEELASTLDELVRRAAELGGGQVNAEALGRSRVEVDHPLIPDQTAGLTVLEAGVQWLAGLQRTDDFRGKQGLCLDPPRRRLVAAVTSGADDMPSAGEPVSDGTRAVGVVQVAFPGLQGEPGLGLLLLEPPYSVPGLELFVGETKVRTVARPTVEPLSWVQAIDQ